MHAHLSLQNLVAAHNNLRNSTFKFTTMSTSLIFVEKIYPYNNFSAVKYCATMNTWVKKL